VATELLHSCTPENLNSSANPNPQPFVAYAALNWLADKPPNIVWFSRRFPLPSRAESSEPQFQSSVVYP
jgi:hypothetical protein